VAHELLTTSSMKAAVVVAIALLSGCHVAPSGDGCPTRQTGETGDTIEGTACFVDHECFVENEFSPCLSGWYRCVDGRFHFDRDIDASDGASCADSPLASCSYEGNPTCETEPASQFCGCDADGTWHCTCACYSPTSYCGACPSRFDPQLEMTACEPVGNTCPYPGGHHCDCVDDGSGTAGKLHCE
jgi:hypothetical protein